MTRPHDAVRPADYPTKEQLDTQPWPELPPFCVECGEEMLTAGDLTQTGAPEWHADERLNPQ